MTQVAAAQHLQEVTRKEVEGRAKLGISAFAEALLGIPKILAENSGYDAQVRRRHCKAHLDCMGSVSEQIRYIAFTLF